MPPTHSSTPPDHGRRVVITGIGAISAAGVGIDPLWDALDNNQSFLNPIQSFDATGMRSALAGELTDFAVRDWVPKNYRKATKVMARDIELCVAAALSAVNGAGWTTQGTDADADPTYPPERVACQIGAGLIAAEVPELSHAIYAAASEGAFSHAEWGGTDDISPGMDSLTPLWLLKYLPNMLACHVTIIHNAQGPSNTITCAEASGPLSLGESLRVIQRGDADAALSGGVESRINALALIRTDFTGALAHTQDQTDGAPLVLPDDPASKGTLLGEGGAILTLEAQDTAQARGATPIAIVSGFGAAHSPASGTARERAQGLIDAIDAALEDANLTANDIDAIAPHASGWILGDEEERAAFDHTFGDRAPNIPLLTLAPCVGDCAAGAGALQAALAAEALKRQALPGRVHKGTPSRLDAGATPARPATLRHILVCTNAHGGQNAAIVLSHPDHPVEQHAS